ncbi:MAG: cytochrome C-552 [Jannaschia sp.]
MTQFRRGAFTAALLVIAGGAQAQTFDPMAAPANPINPMAPATAPASAAPTAPPNAEFGDLPDTAGAEDTFYQCTACHSTAIIRQQRLTDERWDYLWTWMIEKQGMYEPDDETRDIVLAYLKEHFSSER